MAITVEGKDGIKFTVDTIEELKQLEELRETSDEPIATSEEESPLLTSDQLKEGDTVRILTEPGNFEVGEFHGHVKDSIGIVTEVVSENIIEVEAPGELSPSETIIQGHSPSRLERVESLGKDANGEDLFEGDYVTGAPSNGYLYTDDSFIMKVILEEDAVGFGIKTNIGVEIVGEHEAKIDSFKVDSERFIRLSRDLDEAKAKFSEIRGEEVLRKESSFKVGDKVEVIGKSAWHDLDIGDIREIHEVDSEEPKYNLSNFKFDHWANTSDIELVRDSEEPEDGDLVKVTETFEDRHGDIALKGKILEYDDAWPIVFVGTVVLGDNHDKIQLVCRKEDRKDIDL